MKEMSPIKLQIGTLDIALHRKAIKNLNISVLPPMGDVRVSAPLAMSEEMIRLVVIGRLSWIKAQQNKFANQARQSPRQMLLGESHYLWGRRYLLDVVPTTGRHYLEIRHYIIKLFVHKNTTYANRLLVLEKFYRDEMKREIAKLLDIWQKKMGVEAKSFGVKKMKTLWGSCNTNTQTIWLNLELVKKPKECLEYVVVHELVHLLERYHNDKFMAYMDEFLPNWRHTKKLLNELSLGV